jgi:hypothetical protein
MGRCFLTPGFILALTIKIGFRSQRHPEKPMYSQRGFGSIGQAWSKAANSRLCGAPKNPSAPGGVGGGRREVSPYPDPGLQSWEW